jgi:hypothetical protein
MDWNEAGKTLMCHHNERVPLDCAMHNNGALEEPRLCFRSHLSRRTFACLAAFGALLPMVLPVAGGVGTSSSLTLVRHRGWVLRADDLQRLGIE